MFDCTRTFGMNLREPAKAVDVTKRCLPKPARNTRMIPDAKAAKSCAWIDEWVTHKLVRQYGDVRVGGCCTLASKYGIRIGCVSTREYGSTTWRIDSL